MLYRSLHPWSVSTRRARAIQERLRLQLILSGELPAVHSVAGADASYSKVRGEAYAAVVVLRLPGFELVEQATATLPLRFPYVPGLLSFREAPVLLRAFRAIRHRPDALIVDGQGYAHPRRLGLASHLGLILDLPTAGCAKSRLIGTHQEPGLEKGGQAPLIDRDETIGSVVRTVSRVKPVYVSAGHRLSLAMSVALVLRCVSRFRLPEPIRLAHRAVTLLRRRSEG